MSLVVTKTDEQRIQGQFGDKRRVLGSLAFDNSYVTNGLTLLNSQLGLDTVSQMIVYPSSGYVFEYVGSTGSVKAYVTGATNAVLNEVAANTDLSAINTVPFEAIGV